VPLIVTELPVHLVLLINSRSLVKVPKMCLCCPFPVPYREPNREHAKTVSNMSCILAQYACYVNVKVKFTGTGHEGLEGV
jgi:hypothetical protein